MTGDTPSPTAGFRFGVEIQGLVVGWFSECTSLSAERAVLPYEEGGVSSHTLQLPGQTSYTSVTLRGGLAGSVLWDWFQSGQYDGATQRRGVTIIVFDPGGGETARWELLECLPLKWVGPAYTAGAGQVSIEEIQIGRGESSDPLGTVQRVTGGTAATVSEGEPAAALDLQALAHKVYALMRQDLRVERDRRGQRRP